MLSRARQGALQACRAQYKFKSHVALQSRSNSLPDNASSAKRPVDFGNTATAYDSFATSQLLRSWLVLRMCAVRPLVANADHLLRLSYGVLGNKITDAVLRRTFFAHFCAGETAEEVGVTARRLRALGVNGILDYAAEADVPKQQGDGIVGRTYDYESEAKCDAHAKVFAECIRAVKDQTPGGFAAVKMTALGDPSLLRRATVCLRELRNLFVKFDKDGNGVIDRAEFEQGYREWFRAESDADKAAWRKLADKLDPDNRNAVDYIDWSNRLLVEDLLAVTDHCRSEGPLKRSALPEKEARRVKAMHARITRLAEEANRCGVRLMIDAEQTHFQPAIDGAVYRLQRRFNAANPTIFTTYQCYLKETPEKLATDLARAKRGDYVFAAKLVRGAYMVAERAAAAEQGRDSPIYDVIEETHRCYNQSIEQVLDYMAKGNRAELMVATHNQASVEHTLDRMQQLNIPPHGSVCFSQLLGMADHLSFSLGRAGYLAFKYIPFGPVHETVPYLLRRAQENGDILTGSGGGGARHERQLLAAEIARRLGLGGQHGLPAANATAGRNA